MCPQNSCQRFIFLNQGTYVHTIREAELLRTTLGVEDIVFSRNFLRKRYQERIDSHASRIGYVVCRKTTRKSADTFAKNIIDKIKKGLIVK